MQVSWKSIAKVEDLLKSPCKCRRSLGKVLEDVGGHLKSPCKCSSETDLAWSSSLDDILEKMEYCDCSHDSQDGQCDPVSITTSEMPTIMIFAESYRLTRLISALHFQTSKF